MNFKELLQIIAIAIVVFAAGFFILDKFLVWKYHLQEVSNPCQVCLDLDSNKEFGLEQCFKDKLTYVYDPITKKKTYGTIKTNPNIKNFDLNFTIP